MRTTPLIQTVLIQTLCVLIAATGLSAEAAGWRAGLAKADITPKQPMWLAGYGGRDHPSEGTLHPIWIKGLALEDERGYRVVLLTTDLCGLPKWMYDSLCAAMKKKHGLEREQIRITNSHNHCAPAVRGDLEDYYPLDEEQRRRVYEYSDWLEQQMLKTMEEALTKLHPVTLSAGEGVCTFAVNRRNNKEAEIPAILERGETPKGPVDHSVPVLEILSPDGKPEGIVFGYACHNTVLSFYQWCGDYAGFAQIALEKKYSGVQAMFVDGCGGDQNPLPRRTVELAEKYGNQLAESVVQVVQKPMRTLNPRLRASFEFVDLPFERNPTKAELEGYAKTGSPVRKRWAVRMLKKIEASEPFAKSAPFAIQAWMLGDQLWIALGGESLVGYSLRFKQEYGTQTWVTSYFADLTAYIPTRKNWEEGGYEVNFLHEYMLPADKWTPDVEERISAGVARLVKKVRD